MNLRNNRGQAMLETVLLVALVGLAVGMALRALGFAHYGRADALETYYSLFFP